MTQRIEFTTNYAQMRKMILKKNHIRKALVEELEKAKNYFMSLSTTTMSVLPPSKALSNHVSI